MENTNLYQKKYFDCKALDVDIAKKQVKIAIGKIGNIDNDGDMIMPEAVTRTINNNGPKGANIIWHLLDHTPTFFNALSKFHEMGIEDNFIYGVSRYKDNFAWRELAWPQYEANEVNQHSIGYSVVKSQPMSNYRELQELKLYEGSAVLWGANDQTPTLSLLKSLGISEKDSVISQLERLTKAIKHGKHEDESHKELIILDIKRIQSNISALQQNATASDIKVSTHPGLEDKEMIEALAIMNAKFIGAL